MSTRQIILLLVTALYFWLCHWFICCKVFAVCYGCGEGQISQVTPAPAIQDDQTVAQIRDPLLFDWTSSKPVTSPGFPEYKDGIVAEMNDDNILEITGEYFSDEPIPDGYDNMGFARAERAKQLFLDEVPDARITTRARVVTEREGVRDDLFKSATFNWIEPVSDDDGEDVARVEEVGDKALIYFPFNSTNKLADAEIESYLNDVAQRVKKSGEKIRLTGHTDNVGNAAANLTLGQKRADVIKTYLVSRGVASQKIITDSKGSSTPIADNSTDSGRAQNRRTELQII